MINHTPNLNKKEPFSVVEINKSRLQQLCCILLFLTSLGGESWWGWHIFSMKTVEGIQRKNNTHCNNSTQDRNASHTTFLVSKWLQVNGRNKMSSQQFHIKVKNVMAFKHVLSNLVNNSKILRSWHSFVFFIDTHHSLVNHWPSGCSVYKPGLK